MELSGSRKTIRIIAVFLLAVSVSAAVWCFSLSSTLASKDYFCKHAVNGAVTAECEKQLTAKFLVLEAESGIPHTVFETVKNEYPVSTMLSTAIQNNFRNEDATLYTKSLEEHFELLCTDYLDGNGINYNKKYVKNTAQKAAEIYSDTVGVHNIKTAEEKMSALKSSLSVYFAIAFITGVLSTLAIAIVYGDRKRAGSYILSGFTGGFAASAFGAFLCRIYSPFRTLDILPSVYNGAIVSMFNKTMLYTFAASAFLTLVSCAASYMTFKKAKKKKS